MELSKCVSVGQMEVNYNLNSPDFRNLNCGTCPCIPCFSEA